MAALAEWNPDDKEFWDKTGKRIAVRNLWISIPNLLCAFAVWLFWSIIVVAIQKLHDASVHEIVSRETGKNLSELQPDGVTQILTTHLNDILFSFAGWTGGVPVFGDAYRSMLYTIPAVAGLAGATLRIPNSFMIAISGGRNVIAMTTLLLIVPALGVGIVLQNPHTPFELLIGLAIFSGVGGGAFASSMSNISFFFPKHVQGTSLGLNAGLGNLGVSVMQVLLPFVMTFALFGALGGDAYRVRMDGHFTKTWVQNCGLVWVPILVVSMILAWLFMNNLPQHKIQNTMVAVGRFCWLEILGFIGAVAGVLLLVIDWGPIPDLIKIFAIVVVAVLVTLALMRWATPGGTRDNLRNQFAIFRNKHNWLMTWLYVMTFGSFIGFSNAFPKLITDVFGYARVAQDGAALHSAIEIADAPNALYFAWLGPLVGSLIRPVGGWMADKWGGARVTHWDTVVMIASTIGVAVCVGLARSSPDPGQYFVPFLILFLVLFITTGIGNGSTFRMVPIIFKPEHAGPVLGWTSAIAAYGAFLIPRIFADSLAAGVPEAAFYGFAVYYVSCLGVNWWFYARKNAEMPC